MIALAAFTLGFAAALALGYLIFVILGPKPRNYGLPSDPHQEPTVDYTEAIDR